MAKKEKRIKRAITLAGGGPAAGLHIGALEVLEKEGIEFDVWALSCIGGWVGVYYNQCPLEHRGKGRAEQTYEFFRDNIFRDTASYRHYPVNRAFAPDFEGFAQAWATFFSHQENYEDWLVPDAFAKAVANSVGFLSNPQKWFSAGDRTAWLHNDVLAVNPVSRFMTSLIYLSRINGFTKIYYPDSSFLGSIAFKRLADIGAPEIYHNAWNLDSKTMQLFNNKWNTATSHKYRSYQPITAQSLCACSALPYIEQTVTFPKVGHDGNVLAGTEATYCEGALVDTVNFKDLLEDHDDLDEVWVSRIVDVRQVSAPTTLAGGLANLCMLFPGALGQDDVNLFRQHLRKRHGRRPRIIEIPVSANINSKWDHDNLEQGRLEGQKAAKDVMAGYWNTLP